MSGPAQRILEAASDDFVADLTRFLDSQSRNRGSYEMEEDGDIVIVSFKPRKFALLQANEMAVLAKLMAKHRVFLRSFGDRGWGVWHFVKD